jgi:hypothetical protein
MSVRIRFARSIAVALFLLAGLACASSAAQLLRIVTADKAEFVRLRKAAPEVGDCGATVQGDAVEFPADDGRAAELTTLGFEVEIKVPNLEQFYADRLGNLRDYGGYHTYTTAIAAMDALQAAHPNIMSAKQSIGTTVEGRQIYVYKISDSPNADNGKPEVFFNAYIHAREPITFEIVYDLADSLVSRYGTDPRMTWIVDNRQIWIEPVVNPDGVEYNSLTNPNGGGMWRKNRRHNLDGSIGVDLNRNFGYQWGVDNIGSSPSGYDETYRGSGPFSEAETQAMRNFCNAHQFTGSINNHSYGGLELFSWGYDNVLSPDYDGLLALGYMRNAGSGYTPGNPWQILYRVNGECSDWMYGEQGTKPKIYAFVTESGTWSDGFWPAPNRIPALLAQNREGNFRLCELADDPMRILPPGVAEPAAPDTVPTTFTLHWSVPNPDASNPATAWNLIQATFGTIGQDNVEGFNQSRWNPHGWAVSTTRSHSATHSWFSGNNDQMNNVLTSRRGHKVLTGESLKFWTWYNIETGYDYGYVEVATDARHYTALPGSITTNADPNGQNSGNGVNGSSNWVQATFSLESYVGQTIWVRFHYVTDQGTSNGGWYVDDIEPSDLFLNETTVATNLSSPQYTFTGHPEGTFSYLVQSVDAEGEQAVWSAPERLVVHGAPAGVDGQPAVAWRGLTVDGSPFRGSVVLHYEIPASGRVNEPVRLDVHDLTGREVAVLRTGVVGSGLTAGAVLQTQWSPRDLAAGIYFARLTVGRKTSEQRLVYLK